MSEAPKPIIDLIERFERNVESYHNTTYNETQVRQEFINPFFEALGWDITNKAGHAEAYKDVIHEDAIKIGSATKAPDYCFRIGGQRKFFLEAKKPSVSIKDDLSPAYQLRRYAWSAKLPLSILTDFEEFAVYDSRITPRPNDKPSVGRLLYLTYKEYTTRWEEIASIFSKNAVLKGSFDKFALSRKGKRGTSEVDAEFLTEIETWRNSLAHNLALRNPNLTVRDLNFAVQRTIDRIIFLRMCEDRGIEPYGQLQSLLNGENTYDRLRHFYVLADDRYNSGIFHFKSEKGRAESPDELTPSLTIDDKVLKDIIRRLYYPESPYEFSVLSADILGNVYEQFLGKVIRLTTGHRAVIEEKPEVKKAGGVYYTPAYIVDYIVKNTIGKLYEEKTPKQITKLRILDPACGSGSFLIGAYTHLLNYHRDWYVKDGHEKHTKEIYQGAGGQWFLTTQEKKRILLNNIYGVDIDSQAVEVTKLSLLLKVLEGENQDTLTRQLRMWRERALPDLGNNIKCGNSLIGPDYFSGQLLPDEDEMRRVNPFDWKAEFSEIMKAGGFDAVIGNPPYLYSAGQLDIEYFKSNYQLSQYQTDFYVYFIERGYNLTRKGGTLSYIVSNSWLKGKYFSNLRNHFLRNARLEQIAIFDYPVFKQATLENSIFVLSASQPLSTIPLFKFITPSNYQLMRTLNRETCITKNIIDIFGSVESDELLQKIEEDTHVLGSLFEVNRGIHAYRTDGYGRSKFSTGPQTERDKLESSYHSTTKKNKTYFPELKGKDLFRFHWRFSGQYISYGDWLAEPRDPKYFFNPKVALRKIIGKKLIGTYIDDNVVLDQSIYVVIHRANSETALKYCLGILSSKLAAWYLRTKFSIYDKLYPWYTKEHLASFPIKESTGKKLVSLVERMIDLHKQLKTAKSPDDKTRLQRQIDATDKQIDQLAYELYGLTEEEIKIIEAGINVG
jgi:hypothetical protein